MNKNVQFFRNNEVMLLDVLLLMEFQICKQGMLFLHKGFDICLVC